MLKTRVVTAIILTIILIGTAFLPSTAFTISMAIIVMIGAWEWANLAGFEKTGERILYIVINLILLSGIFILSPMHILPLPILSAAIIFWLTALLAIIFYPQSSRYWQHRIFRGLMGLIVLPLMWASFTLLHAMLNGSWLILILWAIVALADIGAYFVGHAFGKTKLAPLVSPGKTREGAYGGILSASIISFVAAYFYTHQIEQAVWFSLLAIAVAIASIVGDLFESMLKRFRGIKDSGNLLPGHGGVLDRIDGWIAAAPVYAFLIVMAV